MALPRFHLSLTGFLEQPPARLVLPDAVSRHVQVLRLQPGDSVVLFDSGDQEWMCEIEEVGKKSVSVSLVEQRQARRELPVDVRLALGMPANDRMDALIEKATELGAASVQPLICSRSVLRLDGERATKRVAHWTGVAVSSTEQSGRTRPLRVEPVSSLSAWLAAQPGKGAAPTTSYVLSTGDAPHLSALLTRHLPPAGTSHSVVLLSGPEGGLSAEEEAAAVSAGFVRASLGPRVLRADTAPLAALALIAAHCEGGARDVD